LTNASAELPFNLEAFRQLGAASFDVALEFMNSLVNHQISFLAAQRDGAAILVNIRTALAAAPVALTAVQQANLTRANLMLGLVSAVVAEAPPATARTLAEKTITVDTLKLDGSSHNPSTDVAMANSILSQCNVRVVHGINATATNPQTTGWLGGNTDLRTSSSCAAATAEERSDGADITMGMESVAPFAATAAGLVSATIRSTFKATSLLLRPLLLPAFPSLGRSCHAAVASAFRRAGHSSHPPG
jgi:hypothetical protein